MVRTAETKVNLEGVDFTILISPRESIHSGLHVKEFF